MADNVGVILAGGRSSRMGVDKAAMLFAGEPLLRRVVGRLSPVVDETLVIGPVEKLGALVPETRVISDIVPGIGPLGGLYTALKVTTSTRIFLMACDMPFVQPGLVQAMLALAEANVDADAVVLRDGSRLQPMHAVYARSCLPAVETALASADHSLQAVLAHLSVKFVEVETVSREDPHGISTFNVNTPENWRHALRLASKWEPTQATNGDQ